MRSRAYNRDISYRKALRKKRLSDAIDWAYKYDGCSYYNNLHQYSKNKIHCSCPLCSAKTRNKGHRRKKHFAKNINYKISDLKKILHMEDEERDL